MPSWLRDGESVIEEDMRASRAAAAVCEGDCSNRCAMLPYCPLAARFSLPTDRFDDTEDVLFVRGREASSIMLDGRFSDELCDAGLTGKGIDEGRVAGVVCREAREGVREAFGVDRATPFL